MSENKTLNYKQGIIVTMVHNSKAESFERRDLNLVIEKTKGSQQLPDTSYSNFGLR